VSAATISGAAASAPIPAQVRDEGAAAVRGYRAALSFESMLLEQMLGEMLPEEEGTSVTTLSQTVAEAVVGAGGLGVAKDLAQTNFTPANDASASGVAK
jgi:hypothetical protein